MEASARIFILLWPIEEEIRPSFRLISSHGIPSQGHTCRSSHHHIHATYTHTRIHPFVFDVYVAPQVHVGPREKQSVPFTGNVYMDRLQSPSLPPTLVVPGFRRARHFTYAARCPLANISGANITTLHGYPCCGFQPELVLSSPGVTAFRVSSIRILRASSQSPSAPAPLNRKAAY